MKKIISIIISLAMILTSVVFMASAEGTYMNGDVNGDGVIRAADARLALRASAGLITLDERQTAAADVNSDALVRANDARLLLRIAAGLDETSDVYEDFYIEMDGVGIAFSGKDVYTSMGSNSDMAAEMSELFGASFEMAFILRENGDIVIIDRTGKSFCNFSVKDQQSMAKMMGGDVDDLGFSDITDGLAGSMYEIYKLTSFDPTTWETMTLNGEECYRVTVQKDGQNIGYIYSASDYKPIAIVTQTGEMRINGFTTAVTQYFTFGDDYTEYDDLLEFMLLHMSGDFDLGGLFG